MPTQEDFTAFANWEPVSLYIDIRPCDRCQNPATAFDECHGFDCEEYQAIYRWIENRVREQCAKGLEEAKALFITNSEKVRVEWDEGFDYIQRAQFNYGFDVAKVIFDGSITLVKGEVK